MYEIYINDRPLRLIATSELPNHQTTRPPDPKTTRPQDHLTARYSGKIKTLLHYADLLEKGSPKVTEVTLHYPDLEQLWTDFKSHYKLVAAAGGIVKLKGTNTYLFIYRRDFLDIPKGKIDPGETIEEAAVREVMEETGLQDVIITPHQTTRPQDHQTTYHTYRNRKDKRVLKPTYWFAMETEQIALIPQTEEDIEWARFLSFDEALNGTFPFYESLRALLIRFKGTK